MKTTLCNNPGKYIRLENGRIIEIKLTQFPCDHHRSLAAINVGIACDECARKLGWIW